MYRYNFRFLLDDSVGEKATAVDVLSVSNKGDEITTPRRNRLDRCMCRSFLLDFFKCRTKATINARSNEEDNKNPQDEPPRQVYVPQMFTWLKCRKKATINLLGNKEDNSIPPDKTPWQVYVPQMFT